MRVSKSEGTIKFTFSMFNEPSQPNGFPEFGKDFPIEYANSDNLAAVAFGLDSRNIIETIHDLVYQRTSHTLRFGFTGLREIVKTFFDLKQVQVCASPMLTDKTFPYPVNLMEVINDGLVWAVSRKENQNAASKMDKSSEVSISFDHVGINITGIHCDTLLYPLACAIVGAVELLEAATTMIAEVQGLDNVRPSEALKTVRYSDSLYRLSERWSYDYDKAIESLTSHSQKAEGIGRVVVGKAYSKHTTKLNLQIVQWCYIPYHLPEISKLLVPQFQLQEFNSQFKAANYKYYPLPAMLALPISNTTEFFI